MSSNHTSVYIADPGRRLAWVVQKNGYVLGDALGGLGLSYRKPSYFLFLFLKVKVISLGSRLIQPQFWLCILTSGHSGLVSIVLS